MEIFHRLKNFLSLCKVNQGFTKILKYTVPRSECQCRIWFCTARIFIEKESLYVTGGFVSFQVLYVCIRKRNTGTVFLWTTQWCRSKSIARGAPLIAKGALFLRASL